MKHIKIALILGIIYVLSLQGYCQTIIVSENNPTKTQLQCSYQFQGGTGIDFKFWMPPANCQIVGNVSGIFLYLKWQNIEASAYPSTIKATCINSLYQTLYPEVSAGPFTLTLPTPTFNGGSNKNIPCHLISSIPISLNDYKNTAQNGIDYNTVITSQFEWTLPSGWQTTTGQTGTFVSSSSISVISPASTSATSISVRAKANTQYSNSTTLQITRNLEAFTISGPTSVVYNSTYRYEVPSGNGVSYSWQLPAGWSGSSTTNYIDAMTGCSIGTISCIMTACGQSKPSTKIISSNVISPETGISGPTFVCSSGNTYTINNLPPVDSIVWTCGPSLTISSGQNTGSCTFSACLSGGWVGATLYTNCGSIALSPVAVRSAITASITGDDLILYQGSGSWTASASGCTPPYSYDWFLRKDDGSGMGALLVGSANPLTLWSVPRTLNLADLETVPSEGINRQPLESTIFYLSVRAGDASMVFVSPEMRIVAYGDVDLVDLMAMKASAEGENTATLQMKISPNPARDEAIVEISTSSNQVLEANTEWQVEIYDAMQSLKTKLPKIKGNQQTINTSGWKEGVYVVRAKVGKEILSEKLVVKH